MYSCACFQGVCVWLHAYICVHICCVTQRTQAQWLVPNICNLNIWIYAPCTYTCLRAHIHMIECVHMSCAGCIYACRCNKSRMGTCVYGYSLSVYIRDTILILVCIKTRMQSYLSWIISLYILLTVLLPMCLTITQYIYAVHGRWYAYHTTYCQIYISLYTVLGHTVLFV